MSGWANRLQPVPFHSTGWSKVACSDRFAQRTIKGNMSRVILLVPELQTSATYDGAPVCNSATKNTASLRFPFIAVFVGLSGQRILGHTLRLQVMRLCDEESVAWHDTHTVGSSEVIINVRRRLTAQLSNRM